MGTIVTPFSKLKLQNVLHVPQLSANLLSIHQLSKDNKCQIIFDADNVVVQDNTSIKLMYHGWSKNGMYPLFNPSTHMALHVGQQVMFIWHKRLGHLTLRVLTQVIKNLNLPVHLMTLLNHIRLIYPFPISVLNFL